MNSESFPTNRPVCEKKETLFKRFAQPIPEPSGLSVQFSSVQ